MCAIAPVVMTARGRPKPHIASPLMRARGTPDARAHPQPRAQSEKAHERSHHGYADIIRRSARNGFNGLLRTAPGGRSFVTRRYRGLTDQLAQSGTSVTCRSLARGIAPGPPTWAVRDRRGRHRHRRASRQAGETPHASERSNTDRVHRIPPRVRDDRDPPLKSRRDMHRISVLYRVGIAIPITKCFRAQE